MSRSNIHGAHLYDVKLHDPTFVAAGDAGTPASVPGLVVTQQQIGNVGEGGALIVIKATMTAMSMAVTDAGASGSSASQKLFDLATGFFTPLSVTQKYTAFAEGAALTGGAGDAAFVMGVGSVAANAGDGALTGTEVDISDVTGTITLSGGTGTGVKTSAAKAAIDGSVTPVDVILNWSGSAATIDANSTISVTGVVTIIGTLSAN